MTLCRALISRLVVGMLVDQSEFYRVCHTKAQYEEEGPRIARHNAVFSAAL